MSIAYCLVEHCKCVGEAYNLVSTTAKVPIPYVKEVCYDEGKLLNSVPGTIPGALLCLSFLSVLANPLRRTYSSVAIRVHFPFPRIALGQQIAKCLFSHFADFSVFCKQAAV